MFTSIGTCLFVPVNEINDPICRLDGITSSKSAVLFIREIVSYNIKVSSSNPNVLCYLVPFVSLI